MKKHYTCGSDIMYLPEPFDNYSITDEGILFKETKPNQIKEIASKPSKKDGYHSVILRSKCGQVSYRYLHRIVLEAFLGANKAQSIHRDGNKSNNRLSNLEYVALSVLANSAARGRLSAGDTLSRFSNNVLLTASNQIKAAANHVAGEQNMSNLKKELSKIPDDEMQTRRAMLVICKHLEGEIAVLESTVKKQAVKIKELIDKAHKREVKS